LNRSNAEKTTLNANLVQCQEEKDKFDTNIQTLTNTNCGTLDVPESVEQNKYSYLADAKLHIPAVEVEGKGVNKVYEVDMCQNEVDYKGTSYTVYLVTDLNDIPTDLEKVTTVNK
jgi:hypothetical protein